MLRVRFRHVAVATLLSLAYVPEAAACIDRANTSCNPSRGLVCCADRGLYCRGSNGQETAGPGSCKARAATPTTSVPPTSQPSTTIVSSTTSSTSPGQPPVTTTLPPISGIPSRWDDPAFASRAYRDSQSILWDPRAAGLVQTFATQYDRQTRVETMWGPFFAEVLGYICTSGEAQHCERAITLTKQVVKFVVRYNFRDPGEPYGWGPNYVWDNWQAMLGVAAQVKAPKPPLVAALVRADYAVKPRGAKVPSRDQEGIFDPQRRFAPLTARQADLLDVAGAAHDRHADAILAWLGARSVGALPTVVAQRKAEMDALAPAVRATQAAFTASARDRWEATIFDQVFAGGIAIAPGDDFATIERAIAMTQLTKRKHHLWHGGFNTRTGQPPNQALVILAMWSHWLTHLRRAIPVPILMAEPLFDESERTPTGLSWAALYPKCTRAAVLNGTYDVHYCPDIVE